MSWKSVSLLLLLDKYAGSGFGRTESARRVPGRTARKNWVGEQNKFNDLYSLIPAFSLKGEGADACVDTYAQGRRSGTCVDTYAHKRGDRVMPMNRFQLRPDLAIPEFLAIYIIKKS
jgi:hypothetical protein